MGKFPRRGQQFSNLHIILLYACTECVSLLVRQTIRQWWCTKMPSLTCLTSRCVLSVLKLFIPVIDSVNSFQLQSPGVLLSYLQASIKSTSPSPWERLQGPGAWKELKYHSKFLLLCSGKSLNIYTTISGVPRNFVRGGGFNKFSWEQREWGSGDGSPVVRGSGGSCNLVHEISFHIVKFS